VPEGIDALFRFKVPMNGFVGILLEAKSGSQPPEVAYLLFWLDSSESSGIAKRARYGVGAERAVLLIKAKVSSSRRHSQRQRECHG